jgi:hypothetical protein
LTHRSAPAAARPAEPELEQELAGVKDSALRHTLQFGIGLHHAGLPDSDREAVERLYVAGKIQVGASAGRWRAVGRVRPRVWCRLCHPAADGAAVVGSPTWALHALPIFVTL